MLSKISRQFLSSPSMWYFQYLLYKVRRFNFLPVNLYYLHYDPIFDIDNAFINKIEARELAIFVIYESKLKRKSGNLIKISDFDFRWLSTDRWGSCIMLLNFQLYQLITWELHSNKCTCAFCNIFLVFF